MTEIYEYQVINLSLEPKQSIEAAANRWAAMGWRTVSVMAVSNADRRAGFSTSILIERKKEGETLEENIRKYQARTIAREIREEFPPSDIPDYIDRVFGGRE